MLMTIRFTYGLILAALLQGCTALGGTSTSNDAVSERRNLSQEQLMELVQQADTAYQREQWSNASSLYLELLAVLPDDPYAWFRLGNALTQQGQYSQAILAYENSLNHDAVQAKPWFNLSTTYLLGAQVATLRAWESAGISNSTRDVAKRRLDVLTVLLQ